jgi:hypothetical protein
MHWNYLVAGCIILVFAGLTGAEYLSTSITTDGTIMLTASGQNENGSFVSRVMAVDGAELHRAITGDDQLSADVSVDGAGPVLFSDYAASRQIILSSPACIFLSQDRRGEEQRSEQYTNGILENGRYTISRATGSDLTGETGVNGTGMMIFGSRATGNTSLKSSGFVSGTMTFRDVVRYGGKI